MHQPNYKEINSYSVLDIAPNSSPQSIRKAFQHARSRHHPDRAGGNHETMVRVNLAYEILSDPITRQAHDSYWRIFETSDQTRQSVDSTSTSRQSRTSTADRSPPRHHSSDFEVRTRPGEPLWALRFRVLERVKTKKAEVWAQETARAQDVFKDFCRRFTIQRKNLAELAAAFALSLIIGTILPVVFLISVLIGWGFMWKLLSGISIGDESFRVFRFPTARIQQCAQKAARQLCEAEVHRLDGYVSELGGFLALVMRPSTLDESEEQVARRLVGAFFIMGYMPTYHDSAQRILLFTDGEESILVRFRHRDGTATNISYVKKVVENMRFHKAVRGFLFCSPGLSGNAAQYADSHRIKWYTLETMNEWINQLLVSQYAGPLGDILENLDKAQKFLGTLSRALPARGYGLRSRRYRR